MCEDSYDEEQLIESLLKKKTEENYILDAKVRENDLSMFTYEHDWLYCSISSPSLSFGMLCKLIVI